jgi:hypothetical protein
MSSKSNGIAPDSTDRYPNLRSRVTTGDPYAAGQLIDRPPPTSTSPRRRPPLAGDRADDARHVIKDLHRRMNRFEGVCDIAVGAAVVVSVIFAVTAVALVVATMTLSCAQQFEQFHTENPRVYEQLLHLAREWISHTGRREIGIGALTERVRWEIALATNHPDFKINKNFRAYYARLSEIEHPDLADVFRTRTSAADVWAREYIARRHATEFNVPDGGLCTMDISAPRRGDLR